MLAQRNWPIGERGEAVDKLDCKNKGNNHGAEEADENPQSLRSSLKTSFHSTAFL